MCVPSVGRVVVKWGHGSSSSSSVGRVCSTSCVAKDDVFCVTTHDGVCSVWQQTLSVLSTYYQVIRVDYGTPESERMFKIRETYACVGRGWCGNWNNYLMRPCCELNMCQIWLFCFVSSTSVFSTVQGLRCPHWHNEFLAFIRYKLLCECGWLVYVTPFGYVPASWSLAWKKTGHIVCRVPTIWWQKCSLNTSCTNYEMK